MLYFFNLELEVHWFHYIHMDILPKNYPSNNYYTIFHEEENQQSK